MSNPASLRMRPLTVQSLAKQFCHGHYVNTVDARLWRQTFEYIVQMQDLPGIDKSLITALWYQYGGDLRALIKNDALVLSVLKKCLPNAHPHQANGITLYRGESWFLFDQNQIGFCWTPSEALATTYAKGLNAVESGGVLLKCFAPADAILAAPATAGEIKQNLYICDPGRLLRLTTLALFPKP
jgi:hypothetical protein